MPLLGFEDFLAITSRADRLSLIVDVRAAKFGLPALTPEQAEDLNDDMLGALAYDLYSQSARPAPAPPPVGVARRLTASLARIIRACAF